MNITFSLLLFLLYKPTFLNFYNDVSFLRNHHQLNFFKWSKKVVLFLESYNFNSKTHDISLLTFESVHARRDLSPSNLVFRRSKKLCRKMIFSKLTRIANKVLMINFLRKVWYCFYFGQFCFGYLFKKMKLVMVAKKRKVVIKV